MRVVVTNDDGIDSVGVQVLAAELARDGRYEVVVVAPDGDRSGTGASLGHFSLETRLDARSVELPEAPGLEAWALDATPAMCVLAALLGGFGAPPDLVVSGINAGSNTGRAILHSGTVGAVLTGQNFGLSGLAVSTQAGRTWHWDTAAKIAVEVLELIKRAPSRSGLNLNVPARPRDEVLGVRWARLAPFGEVRAAMKDMSCEDEDDRRRLQMELQFSEQDFDPDSDQGLVKAGWASLTTLVGVAEAWPLDENLGMPPDVATMVERIVPGAALHPAHEVPDASPVGSLRRPLGFP